MVIIIRNILDYIEDILILSGLTCIVWATFLLSKIAGLYAIGLVLFGLGAYIAINPPRR